ncbi:MAG: nucleotidyltransferase family protein [Steroidobacteraceae bacterium]
MLAAGAGSRFGSAKQLARVGDRPMIHIAITRAVAVAGQATVVVLGAHAASIAPMLRHTPASIIVNRQWRSGLASSIRLAVERLPAGVDAALITLADQPLVTAADLRRLVSAWRRQPQYACAAQYGSDVGVPAIFPRSMFGDLLGLRGDRGAQVLLSRYRDRVIRVAMPAARLDVDHPEDLLEVDTRLASTSA